MAIVHLFGPARTSAGTAACEVSGASVAEVIERLATLHGSAFAAVLAESKVYLGSEPALPSDTIGPNDELSVLPPVSGG